MNDVVESALRMLAQREHGAQELCNKLMQKGFERRDIADAIAHCQSLGLQSDARFVESRCQLRIRQGYGPIRIRKELQQLNVEETLLEAALATEASSWTAHALRVWNKKYHGKRASSFKEQQKQKQFLLYRGFSTDIIASIFNY